MEKVRDRIIEAYDSMTTVERGVADFFLKNEDLMDFSSRNISGLLHFRTYALPICPEMRLRRLQKVYL